MFARNGAIGGSPAAEFGFNVSMCRGALESSSFLLGESVLGANVSRVGADMVAGPTVGRPPLGTGEANGIAE